MLWKVTTHIFIVDLACHEVHYTQSRHYPILSNGSRPYGYNKTGFSSATFEPAHYAENGQFIQDTCTYIQTFWEMLK